MIPFHPLPKAIWETCNKLSARKGERIYIGFAQQIAAVIFVLESLFQIGKLFEDIAGFLNAFLKTYGRIFIAIF